VTPITGTFLVLNTLLWLIYFGSGQPASWQQALLVPNDFSAVALLTSQFVHESALHLALNMLLLWTFGRSVERGLGSGLFAVLYLGSGVFAGLLHIAVAYLFQADVELATPAGGASGAVAGVMGAYAAMYADRRVRVPFLSRGLAGVTVILAWLGWEAAQAVVALVHGVSLGVGHWAHVGGLVCGLIMGPAMAGGSRTEARTPSAPPDAELPETERSPFVTTTEAAASAVERLTRVGAREHALVLYRQAIEDGHPLSLPGPVEFRLAVWLLEEEDWAGACDAFLSIAHSETDADQAAKALFRAMQVAREQLGRTQLAERLRNELLVRYPDSPWNRMAEPGTADAPPTPEAPGNG
jgi:rhomboid family protein